MSNEKQFYFIILYSIDIALKYHIAVELKIVKLEYFLLHTELSLTHLIGLSSYCTKLQKR